MSDFFVGLWLVRLSVFVLQKRAKERGNGIIESIKELTLIAEGSKALPVKVIAYFIIFTVRDV